jgi:membrane protein YqaA with SNARE-associated domain
MWPMNIGTEPAPKKSWKQRVLSISIIVLVVGLSVGLFLFAQRFPDKVREFGNYGYLGVFIGSLISNATIILPVPGVLVLFPLVANLNPILVALAGSTGGIIGELSSYMAGFGGQAMVNKGRLYERVEGWMQKWGGWTIFVFAFAPIVPFDVAGLVGGAMRYPLWKFLLIGWIGKSLKYIWLVYAAIWGLNTLLRFFGS